MPPELQSRLGGGPPPPQHLQQRQPPPQNQQGNYMNYGQEMQHQQHSAPPGSRGYGAGPGPEDPYENQLQDLLSQAEKVRDLPNNWLLCRSPRGHFYYNTVTQRVSIDLPAELNNKQGPPPQQQFRHQGPPSGQGAYMQH